MMFRGRVSVLFPELEKGSAASPLRVRHHFKHGCQTAYGDVCSWQLVTLQHQKSMFASRLFSSRASFAYLKLSGRVWCKTSRLFLIDCTFTLRGPVFAPLLQKAHWFLQACHASSASSSLNRHSASGLWVLAGALWVTEDALCNRTCQCNLLPLLIYLPHTKTPSESRAQIIFQPTLERQNLTLADLITRLR